MERDKKESIVREGVEYELLPGTFYHLAAQDSLVFWNAYLGKGFLASISVMAQVNGLDGVTTPYHLANQQDLKEQIWETVRETKFPSKPSRMKALFLFDDLDAAMKANERWFAEEGRRLLKARVLSGAQTHKGDSRWLDSYEHEWESKAMKYWAGKMTDAPVPEVILHGTAYFLDWEEPPFGSLAWE